MMMWIFGRMGFVQSLSQYFVSMGILGSKGITQHQISPKSIGGNVVIPTKLNICGEPWASAPQPTYSARVCPECVFVRLKH